MSCRHGGLLAAVTAFGAGTQGGKYVPPSRRGGSGRIGESMVNTNPRQTDTVALRVSNLSENTQKRDLQDLFKPFGRIARTYLTKDKVTGECKGFAFINYYRLDDAKKAIMALNGFGYDHLILNVEWSKPCET